MRDIDILRLLADRRGRSVRNLAEHFAVSSTRITQHLNRLMLAQAVTRKRNDSPFRGARLGYVYFISREGLKTLAAERQAAPKPKKWVIWG
jgi:predicted transcriptional regulator